MKTVTYEEFLGFYSCWLKDAEKAKWLKEIGKRKESWTALDVLAFDEVEAKDRLCAVLREEFLPADLLHEYACRCAEKALEHVDSPDPRGIAAITAKRQWLRGEITDEELAEARIAAWRAAVDSVDVTTLGATASAAQAEAVSAARAAARDTALAVAWGELLEMLIDLIKAKKAPDAAATAIERKKQ